jgi:hypothetical protein
MLSSDSIPVIISSFFDSLQLTRVLPFSDAEKTRQRTDFALGYDWADARDQGEQGLLFTQPS